MRQHCMQYALLEQVCFDQWGHELATFKLEASGCLRVEGSTPIHQLVASLVKGRNGGLMTRKGYAADHLSDPPSYHLVVDAPLQNPIVGED